MTFNADAGDATSILISETQIVPVKPRNGLLGFASFVLDHQFYVGDIAICSRPDGSDYRLVYPRRILQNGKMINCLHPMNREAAHQEKEAIVNVFEELIGDRCPAAAWQAACKCLD